jgi:hypothetical protein
MGSRSVDPITGEELDAPSVAPASTTGYNPNTTPMASNLSAVLDPTRRLAQTMTQGLPTDIQFRGANGPANQMLPTGPNTYSQGRMDINPQKIAEETIDQVTNPWTYAGAGLMKAAKPAAEAAGNLIEDITGISKGTLDAAKDPQALAEMKKASLLNKPAYQFKSTRELQAKELGIVDGKEPSLSKLLPGVAGIAGAGGLETVLALHGMHDAFTSAGLQGLAGYMGLKSGKIALEALKNPSVKKALANAAAKTGYAATDIAKQGVSGLGAGMAVAPAANNILEAMGNQ